MHVFWVIITDKWWFKCLCSCITWIRLHCEWWIFFFHSFSICALMPVLGIRINHIYVLNEKTHDENRLNWFKYVIFFFSWRSQCSTPKIFMKIISKILNNTTMIWGSISETKFTNVFLLSLDTMRRKSCKY